MARASGPPKKEKPLAGSRKLGMLGQTCRTPLLICTGRWRRNAALWRENPVGSAMTAGHSAINHSSNQLQSIKQSITITYLVSRLFVVNFQSHPKKSSHVFWCSWIVCQQSLDNFLPRCSNRTVFSCSVCWMKWNTDWRCSPLIANIPLRINVLPLCRGFFFPLAKSKHQRNNCIHVSLCAGEGTQFKIKLSSDKSINRSKTYSVHSIEHLINQLIDWVSVNLVGESKTSQSVHVHCYHELNKLTIN